MQLQHSIIVTKLYPPVARSGLIARRRLDKLLSPGSLPKLVLVTAPAGYGKSTLLAQWVDLLRCKGYDCAWFSLERSDSEPVEFLRYLITALRTEIGDLGEESLRTLESRSNIDPLEIVIDLINEIARAGREIAVFLDDFHHIESDEVLGIVKEFIDHGPANLHFVLASRCLPNLPIASLRAHAEIMDISMESLRFNAEEGARFLRDARELELSDRQIERLIDRTEGWAAGLQLASLSLDQAESGDEFIRSFSGKARDVTEYLVLDVLNRLEPAIQKFLLYTSILERMNSRVCQCLVDRDGCQDVLDYLEDSNIFLLPLDKSRTWYRYHHLFREFLVNLLRRRHPEIVEELHLRASKWFAEHGYNGESVTYALESRDFDHAALLVERHAARLLKRGQMPRLYRWLKKLPDAITERRPQLPMLRCWALFHMHRPKETTQALQQAEHVIKRLRDEAVEEKTEELKALQEEMKVLRAGVACVHDEVGDLRRLASEPLRENLLLPFHIGVMYNLLGYSCLVTGEFELAQNSLAKSRRYHEQAGSSFGVSYSDIFSGMLSLTQGKMHRAAAYFRQSEDVSILDSGERSAGAAVARLLQGVVLYEWNRLEEAERLLATNIILAEECTIAEALVLGFVTLARIRVVQQRRRDAEECYAKIREVCQRGNYHRLLLQVENHFVRLLIQEGDVATAERVASRLGVNMGEEMVCLTDHWEPTTCLSGLIQARLLLVQDQPHKALLGLRRLRNVAVRAGRIRQSIEILVLMALAEFEYGTNAGMMKHIVAALSLAPSSGMLRIFLDEGEKVGPMLRWVWDHAGQALPASASHQLQAVLALITEADQTAVVQNDRVDTRPGLVEKLSVRELDVLKLIVSGRSNGQIGEQLTIAESTVKWHVKNIFGKLGVKNRTSAALAAQQLRLIPR